VPKAGHEIKADVLWCVLMGPENFNLDLFRSWDRQVGIKVLYIFDTMESHLPSIRRVLSTTDWDYTITSFEGARAFLEVQTQRLWHVVPQGIKLERFRPAPPEEKLIAFCAYGRRLEVVHRNVKKYCEKTGKHYEYTTAATLQSQLNPVENYGIYAWHLNHTIFNFCWPVELTHPARVLTFSPITCRWFEAAASGNVILGQPPKDPSFEEIFGPDMVIPVNYDDGFEEHKSILDDLWDTRQQHLKASAERRRRLADKWSWERRVFQILEIIGVSLQKTQTELVNII
jgi:hypothetical protein